MSREGEVVRDGDLLIRRMRDDLDDYRLFTEWRNRPHVREFWDPDDPPQTLEQTIEEERPDTVPTSSTTACFIELESRPVGFIQFYRWIDYAQDAADVDVPITQHSYSLDLFIGEPDMTGKGVGTRAVDLLSDYLFNELGASEVSLLTEVRNHSAIRAYEKAGFRKVKQVLDTDTYRGQRVRSWFMVKDAPSMRHFDIPSG